MAYDRFTQDSGALVQVEDDGTETLLGTGWAGNDSRVGVNPDHIQGRNNPAMQAVRFIGPLPVGWYTISEPFHHPKLGQLTFQLTPDPENDMLGRGEFFMHGAGGDDPANSSEGCIIQAHDVRQAVADSGVRRLQVVA
jgi:hypothetical protein